MASDLSFVEFLCEQMRGAGPVTSRKMFGEYALYLDEKVIALVCDNQLFLKPTPAGRAQLSDAVDASPYPGAKPHLRIGAELDDAERLSALARLTADALPPAKPKPAKRSPTKPKPAKPARP